MKTFEELISKYADVKKLDNLKYNGNLDFRHCKEQIHLPDNLTVFGFLFLEKCDIPYLPNNLTVTDDVFLHNCTSIKYIGQNITIGGSLYMTNCISLKTIENNLVVGEDLILRGCKNLMTFPTNFIIGNNLDLRLCPNIHVFKTDTIGGISYLSGGKVILSNGNVILTSADASYIKLEKIFKKIIDHKGNVYHVQSIGHNDLKYVVTNGLDRWGYGDSLALARQDLFYQITNIDKSKYSDWNLDTELSREEAIEAYRVITGACKGGSKQFVENCLPKDLGVSSKVKIGEIVKCTKGKFGSEIFKNYFNK